MTYKVVGSGGNTFSDSYGVIPENLSDAGETFAGATVEGNLCFAVETMQLENAALSLQPSFSFGDEARRFLALR